MNSLDNKTNPRKKNSSLLVSGSFRFRLLPFKRIGGEINKETTQKAVPQR